MNVNAPSSGGRGVLSGRCSSDGRERARRLVDLLELGPASRSSANDLVYEDSNLASDGTYHISDLH